MVEQLPVGVLIPNRNRAVSRGSLAGKVTVFLISSGEPTLGAARTALALQSVPFGPVQEITDVAPMSAAFQAMLDRGRTKYHVQVDADMLLHPDAVWSLYEAIEHYHHGAAMVAAPLWDCFEERPIYGVKIYDTAVLQRYPYRDSYSCEVDQLARLKADGHAWALRPLAERAACFGLHGTDYTPRSAFERWLRLVRKQRRSLVLAPPLGQLLWIEKYFQVHLERWRQTGDPVRLAALLGMAMGLAGEDLPEEREQDWRVAPPEWERVRVRYFEPQRLPDWVMDWRSEKR